MTNDQRKLNQVEDLATELSQILSRIESLHEELAQVMIDIDETEMMADYDQLITYRLLEGRLLYRLIDEERQRAIVSEELGDAIGSEDPAEFCVVDATEFLPSALAQLLTTLCQSIALKARGLRAQTRLGEMLGMQAFEHVEVFLSPGAQQLVEQEQSLPAPEPGDASDRLDTSF